MKKNWFLNFTKVFIATGLTFNSLGCSYLIKDNKEPKKTYYTVPSRQLAPEPVYNRIAYARPPEPLPKVDPSIQAYLEKKALEKPKIYLGLNKATTTDLAKNLSQPYGYQFYVSSKLINKKVTFSGSGDIDELAEKIEEQNSLKIVVDHRNKEVRIIPKETTKGSQIPSKNSYETNHPNETLNNRSKTVIYEK